MSVVLLVPSTVCLNDISETTRLRALIFGTKHCLVDFTKFVHTVDLGSKVALEFGGLGIENKMDLKIKLGSDACNLVCCIVCCPLPGLFK